MIEAYDNHMVLPHADDEVEMATGKTADLLQKIDELEQKLEQREGELAEWQKFADMAADRLTRLYESFDNQWQAKEWAVAYDKLVDATEEL